MFRSFARASRLTRVSRFRPFACEFFLLLSHRTVPRVGDLSSTVGLSQVLRAHMEDINLGGSGSLQNSSGRGERAINIHAKKHLHSSRFKPSLKCPFSRFVLSVSIEA